MRRIRAKLAEMINGTRGDVKSQYSLVLLDYDVSPLHDRLPKSLNIVNYILGNSNTKEVYFV